VTFKELIFVESRAHQPQLHARGETWEQQLSVLLEPDQQLLTSYGATADLQFLQALRFQLQELRKQQKEDLKRVLTEPKNSKPD